MKKLTSKLTRKKQPSKKPTRITNETVAEHREQILSGARRFKYPVQYTKYRLVISAIAIGFVVLILAVVFSWWQLYKVQTTSDFFYRLTRMVPVPVATVDGEDVRYGDYLLNYKSSETYLSTAEQLDKNSTSDNAKSQFDYIKAEAMNNAVTAAYASKLAREENISVSEQQVDAAIKRLRQTTSPQGEISQEAYDRSAEQLYGLSPEESRYNVRRSVLWQEVSYSIDDRARQASKEAESLIANTKASGATIKLEVIASALKKKYPEIEVIANSSWVKKNNPDGGMAAAAAKLKKGNVSGPIKNFSGDGYYFVQLLGENEAGEIRYAQIRIPLLEFASRIKKIKADGRVKYYITVPDVRPQIRNDQ